jgi:hypothetical protein
MRTKSLLVAAICAAVVAGAGVSAAFAGEVNGNGKATAGPAHAHSICVFSGQNDDPTSTNPENPGGVAQSYGYSFVRNGLKAAVPSPAELCNGHSGAFAGGGGG